MEQIKKLKNKIKEKIYFELGMKKFLTKKIGVEE